MQSNDLTRAIVSGLNSAVGESMHQLAHELWPISRSITGPGVRETLNILQGHLHGLEIHEVESGTHCYDWVVPNEWILRDAYIENGRGERVIDVRNNNFHIVGYSTPIDTWLDLEDLQTHLHSLPEQPNAIPYVTSYYAERWGFCLSQQQRDALSPGIYHAVVDTTLKSGVLNYADLLISGESEEEVLLSTYVCHPSMANNELSGPVLTAAIGAWLRTLPCRRLSYRLIFIPETIGSIVYLSRHLEELKRKTIAGFVLTCVGDEREYSFLPSRAGNSLSDRAALHVLSRLAPNFKSYSFLDRGSDERQYCSPGVDLPIASVMRSKYGEFPEYHTSLDDLSLVTPAGLTGSFNVYRRIIECLDGNSIPRTLVKCEPQLGRRGLYPTLSTKDTRRIVKSMMNLIAYADGKSDLLQIAEYIKEPMWELQPIAERLQVANLMSLD